MRFYILDYFHTQYELSVYKQWNLPQVVDINTLSGQFVCKEMTFTYNENYNGTLSIFDHMRCDLKLNPASSSFILYAFLATIDRRKVSTMSRLLFIS